MLQRRQLFDHSSVSIAFISTSLLKVQMIVTGIGENWIEAPQVVRGWPSTTLFPCQGIVDDKTLKAQSEAYTDF